MPVTAKLSSRFYEKLGDDVTNELVTWLNAVDAEFRNDLRDANDRNWSQLRAELDAQSARLTAEFRGGLAELRTELRAEIAELRTELRTGLAELRTEMQTGFANIRGETAAGLADGRTGLANLRVEIHQEATRQVRWNFLFWVMTVLTIAGLKFF
ncbi:MAG: hypothetical protein WD553_02785 [Gemmatimonadaceae bacterium]